MRQTEIETRTRPSGRTRYTLSRNPATRLPYGDRVRRFLDASRQINRNRSPGPRSPAIAQLRTPGNSVAITIAPACQSPGAWLRPRLQSGSLHRTGRTLNHDQAADNGARRSLNCGVRWLPRRSAARTTCVGMGPFLMLMTLDHDVYDRLHRGRDVPLS